MEQAMRELVRQEDWIAAAELCGQLIHIVGETIRETWGDDSEKFGLFLEALRDVGNFGAQRPQVQAYANGEPPEIFMRRQPNG